MLAVFLLGSASDHDHAAKVMKGLDELGIPYKEHVASAHKVPEKALEILKQYDASGEQIVYVTMAGRSNALSGFTAANTLNPVIACPPFSDKADYSVNVHSTLQMPSEVPLMTVIDPGNAALAVARIFAVADAGLKKKMGARMKQVKDSFK